VKECAEHIKWQNIFCQKDCLILVARTAHRGEALSKILFKQFEDFLKGLRIVVFRTNKFRKMQKFLSGKNRKFYF
jgi:hypothetical protein